jgi:hypothetical protein
LTAADEALYGLAIVFENGYNLYSVNISAGTANINWGDGTNVNSNGTVQSKVYDYATLGGSVSVWPDGRNYKQALVHITRIGGPIVSVNFRGLTTVNARGGNNFADINCSFPNATTLEFGYPQSSALKGMQLLQRLRVWQRPAGHNTGQFLWGMNGLRVVQYPYSRIASGADFSSTSTSVDDWGDIDMGTATNVNGFIANGYSKKVGNFTANSATTNALSIFADNALLQRVGNITMNAATTMSGCFGTGIGCPNLTKVGLVTAPNVTNLTQFAWRCFQLQELRFANCASVTVTTGMVPQCWNLTVLEMPNLTRGVSLADTAMGNYGMSIFANALGIASGAQTVTVTGTPYGALLTALDATAVAIRNVMTGKGYTVAN